MNWGSALPPAPPPAPAPPRPPAPQFRRFRRAAAPAAPPLPLAPPLLPPAVPPVPAAPLAPPAAPPVPPLPPAAAPVPAAPAPPRPPRPPVPAAMPPVPLAPALPTPPLAPPEGDVPPDPALADPAGAGRAPIARLGRAARRRGERGRHDGRQPCAGRQSREGVRVAHGSPDSRRPPMRSENGGRIAPCARRCRLARPSASSGSERSRAHAPSSNRLPATSGARKPSTSTNGLRRRHRARAPRTRGGTSKRHNAINRIPEIPCDLGDRPLRVSAPLTSPSRRPRRTRRTVRPPLETRPPDHLLRSAQCRRCGARCDGRRRPGRAMDNQADNNARPDGAGFE